jgi:hypothetical protein
MATVGRLIVEIGVNLKALQSGLKQAQTLVKNTSSEFKTGVFSGLTTAAANQGIELLESGLRTTFQTMADGVSKAADLESQLDAIGAISGATEAQIGGLKDVINELGVDPNLTVSAFEAAQAVEELAAGGVALEDIMNGAARGTVALANATGADYAQAATIAADAMSIFNIEADNLGTVVDGVAAVAVQSKFDVNDYALALAQAGGVAKASGVEFDDFNTAITGIAPLFASGSDAGTSFKTMLQRLVPSTNPAKEAMAELGIISLDTSQAIAFLAENGIKPATNSVEDINAALVDYGKNAGLTKEETSQLADSLITSQNSFFTAEGNMRSMAEIAGILDQAFSGLSEEQRNQALSTIFGTDAMRAAVGLMELGGQGFTDLQTAMSNTSGADAAAQRMTNLKGATEILNGVVESLQIQYGDRLLPKLTEMAQKATDFASTQGPALVDSLADLTLGAIDFGERAGPMLERGLGTISGLGEATNRLVEAAMGLGEQLGLVSENAEKADGVMVILNGVVTAATAPYEGLRFVLEGVAGGLQLMAEEARMVKRWIDDLSGSMNGLDQMLPDWLRPGSPPPLAYALEDIRQQIEQMPEMKDQFSVPGMGGMRTEGFVGNMETTVYVDGVSATSVSHTNPADEAIRMTVEMLRQRLKT